MKPAGSKLYCFFLSLFGLIMHYEGCDHYLQQKSLGFMQQYYIKSSNEAASASRPSGSVADRSWW